MRALVIVGQDIRALEVALVTDGALTQAATISTEPDQYLSALAATLEQWGTGLEELSAVAVVTGPGSFTSSRVSTLIANSIGFAKTIPVIGIENAKRLPIGELAAAIDWGRLPSADRFVQPVYDRPPHITTPAPRPL